MHNPIPTHILDFIQTNHVVNIAAHTEQDFWQQIAFMPLTKKMFA